MITSTDDQLRQAMASAMAGFAAVVLSVEDDQWELASPCAGWSVLDVVEHVIAGEYFTKAVLNGAPLDKAVAATQVEITDDAGERLRQLTDAAEAALLAFGGSLDRTIEHRVGTISARRMLGFRIIDELGHTWDVATAIGQAANLDPDALAVGVEIALAERSTLEVSENFATVPTDQPDQGEPLATFLSALGRRPD